LERLISKEHTQTQAGIDLLEGAKLVKTLHLPPPPPWLRSVPISISKPIFMDFAIIKKLQTYE
jgi:hypothetical protein